MGGRASAGGEGMKGIRRFEEIMGEMNELLTESLDIVGEIGGDATYNRAYGYWYAHILGALDKEESDFLGGSMYDMAATLSELREETQ